jgi:hypothetical protein
MDRTQRAVLVLLAFTVLYFLGHIFVATAIR